MRGTVPRPRISRELAERIDAARGDVPFERWVRRALEEKLSGSPTVASPSSDKGPGLSSGDSSAASPRAPEEPSAAEVVESLERPSQKEFQRRAAVPRAAGFNIGPRPFAKPIPKGK